MRNPRPAKNPFLILIISLATQYNFKKFNLKNKRQESRISLTKSHSIGYPKKFWEDNGISNFNFASIYWDSGNLVIAVRFHNNEDDEGAFKIIRNKHGYGGSTIARSFFKIYGIDLGRYCGKYNWHKYHMENVGDVFVINLRDKDKKEDLKNEEKI